jgi:hypothetical protein
LTSRLARPPAAAITRTLPARSKVTLRPFGEKLG